MLDAGAMSSPFPAIETYLSEVKETHKKSKVDYPSSEENALKHRIGFHHVTFHDKPGKPETGDEDGRSSEVRVFWLAEDGRESHSN